LGYCPAYRSMLLFFQSLNPPILHDIGSWLIAEVPLFGYYLSVLDTRDFVSEEVQRQPKSRREVPGIPQTSRPGWFSVSPHCAFLLHFQRLGVVLDGLRQVFLLV
jgi:hypothetical protein